MKYFVSKCYLRLTPFCLYDLILCWLMVFSCVCECVSSKTIDRIRPYFQVITVAQEHCKHSVKPLMSWPILAGEGRLCALIALHDMNAHTVWFVWYAAVQPDAILLRKHSLPIIGVKYITWNYFDITRAHTITLAWREREKKKSRRTVGRFNLGFIR